MATNLPLLALRDGAAFRNQIRRRGVGWRGIISLIVFVCLACAVYGMVLGGWRSARLAAYVAVKLPMLFLGTILLVTVFNWVAALLLGAGFRLHDVLLVVSGAMCVAGWVLLACAPVAFFLIWAAAPTSGLPDELRHAHNVMLLTHIVVLAAAGVIGNAALFKGLRDAVPRACPAGALAAIWLAAYAFVGCQLSWILRPFVGSPFYEVAFLRTDALERNFYEFILVDIARPMLGLGASAKYEEEQQWITTHRKSTHPQRPLPQTALWPAFSSRQQASPSASAATETFPYLSGRF